MKEDNADIDVAEADAHPLPTLYKRGGVATLIRIRFGEWIDELLPLCYKRIAVLYPDLYETLPRRRTRQTAVRIAVHHLHTHVDDLGVEFWERVCDILSRIPEKRNTNLVNEPRMFEWINGIQRAFARISRANTENEKLRALYYFGDYIAMSRVIAAAVIYLCELKPEPVEGESA